MARTSGARTADAVYNTAAELFFRRGYEPTSLREIASSVGIQVGSLYNHIDGKHDLLQTIMMNTMRDLIDAMESAIDHASGPVGRLESALDCHIRFHATHSRAVFIGNSELRSLEPDARKLVGALRREYARMLTSLVEDVERAGIGKVIDAELQAYAIIAIGTHLASWYRPGASPDLDDVVATYIETIRRQLQIASHASADQA